MTVFMQATFEGLSLGAVYSLVAIGFVLIYRATDVLSFAQPALAVVGAGIISALSMDRGVPFWGALIIGIIINPLLLLLQSSDLRHTYQALLLQPFFYELHLAHQQSLKFSYEHTYWLKGNLD